MINKFLEQVNKYFETESYQEIYDLCQGELEKLAGDEKEYSQEESNYIATIYSVMADILEPQEALPCLDCAISFVPNNAQLYMQRAAAKEELENFQGAIEDYSIILEHIQSIEAFGARGNAKMNIGDLDGAAEDFKAIFQLDPSNVSAKRAFVSIKANQAEGGLQYMQCTLKTGEEVVRFVIDGDVIDIPADQY